MKRLYNYIKWLVKNKYNPDIFKSVNFEKYFVNKK